MSEHVRKIIVAALLAAVAGTVATGAQGQPAGPQATIFRDQKYSGPSRTITAANPDLGLTWRVNSVRVESGTWELCEQTQFRPPCHTYDADTPQLNTVDMGHRIRSMRPAPAR